MQRTRSPWLSARFKALGASLLFIATLGCSQIQADTLPEPKKPISFSEFLGVNTPFLFFDRETYTKQIKLLKALGLKWVRIDLHWYHLEPEQGRYNLAPLDELMRVVQQEQLIPVVYLVGSAKFASTAPADDPNIDQWPPRSNEEFAARMASLAKRYPFVKYWQIWNEPNINPFWQPKEDPQAYAKLVKVTADVLRTQAPEDQVVLGGMAYYSQMPMRSSSLMLEELGKLGALKLVDVVAYHPYTDEPEGDPATSDPDNFIKRAVHLNTALRSAGVKNLWATEFGWSTYKGPKVIQPIINETTQADYFLRRLVLMMTLDYDRVFWFSLSDLDQRVAERDQFYGMITLDGKPKPIYAALQNFLSVAGARVTPTASLQPSSGNPIATYSTTWRRSDGTTLWFFWGKNIQTVKFNGIQSAVLHQPVSGTKTNIIATAGLLSVPVQPYLQILEIR